MAMRLLPMFLAPLSYGFQIRLLGRSQTSTLVEVTMVLCTLTQIIIIWLPFIPLLTFSVISCLVLQMTIGQIVSRNANADAVPVWLFLSATAWPSVTLASVFMLHFA